MMLKEIPSQKIDAYILDFSMYSGLTLGKTTNSFPELQLARVQNEVGNATRQVMHRGCRQRGWKGAQHPS